MDRVLESAINNGASDIQLKVGCKPCVRVSGKLRDLETGNVDGETVSAIANTLIASKAANFYNTKDEGVSFAYTYHDKEYRFRVHAWEDINGSCVSLRVIPSEIIPIE